jgi:hypothetical protein
MMRWRSAITALSLSAALWPSTALGDDALVVGGVVSSGFSHSSGVLAEDPVCQTDPTLADCAKNDLRFRAGALAAYRRRSAGAVLNAALYAGALIALRNEAYRKPLGTLNLAYMRELFRDLELAARLNLTLEPLSAERARGTQVVAKGNELLIAEPEAELETGLGPRRRLRAAAGARSVFLLTDEQELGMDEVAIALGVHARVELEHELDATQGVQARAVGRLMQARTKRRGLPPATGLVGGLVGYRFHRGDWLNLHALVGAGRVINMGAESHLWPVVPLIDVEAALDTRLDRFSAAVVWGVEENAYYVGLPAQTLTVRVGWSRYPSGRSWYALTELSYEFGRSGEYVDNFEQTSIVTALTSVQTHSVQLRGRLTYLLSGGFRIFGEIAGTYGSEDPPIQVAGQPDLGSGLVTNALVGVAFVLLDRPEHERLLSDVW